MIFTFLFTPYGYKFEGKLEDGKIYEEHWTTSTQQATKLSWKYANNGFVNLQPDETGLQQTGNKGIYWNSLSHSGTLAYNIWFNNLDLFPANYADKFYGMSVRCVKTIYLLFTPYGYKFEYGVSWSDRLIREEYRSTGVKQPWYNPWRINRNGYVNSSGGSLQRIMNGGWHWCSTSVAFSSSDSIWIDSGDLYPAVDGNRSFGFSVRQ